MQYTKCLTIVALVVVLSILATPHEPPVKVVNPVKKVLATVAIAPAAAAPISYIGCDWVNLYQDWNTAIAKAICLGESSGRADTYGTNIDGSIDRGLMEINSVHADMVNGDLNSLYDPATNVRVGHQLWAANGWQPWSVYNSGKYLRYL